MSGVVLSLSEIRSLVTKAARGGGMSWGLAEEAGWAAEWLVRRRLPAAPWATLWLQDRLTGTDGPVEAGVALADRLAFAEGTFAPVPLPDVGMPGYLLPFLHLIALRHGAVTIQTAIGLAAHIPPAGEVTFGPAWADRSTGWSLTLLPPAHGERGPETASVIDCLEGLALRTTVPPSARSRADAGSARGDND